MATFMSACLSLRRGAQVEMPFCSMRFVRCTTPDPRHAKLSHLLRGTRPLAIRTVRSMRAPESGGTKRRERGRGSVSAPECLSCLVPKGVSTSTHIGRNWANYGRTLPYADRSRAKVRPHFAASYQKCSKVGRCRAISAPFPIRPFTARFGRNWPNFGQHRYKFGPKRPEHNRCWVCLGSSSRSNVDCGGRP